MKRLVLLLSFLLLICTSCSPRRTNSDSLDVQVEVQTESNEDNWGIDDIEDEYDNQEYEESDTSIPEDAEDIEIIIPGD